MWIVLAGGFGYCMYQEGKATSYREAFDLGYNLGYKRGQKNGYSEGYQKEILSDM
jgi:flagellar biosynthesis/type III secretory pathway protein FliH